MSLDYLSHFSLSAEPFSKDIGDAELWLPPSKLSLVEDLTDAMHARASALLTGEPGVGKTCVLRALRHALAPANFRLVYCQNSTIGRRDFYRHLCLALGLAKANTAGDLFLAVSSHVEDLAPLGLGAGSPYHLNPWSKTWGPLQTGLARFRAYCWCSTVAHNLLTIARTLLPRAALA